MSFQIVGPVEENRVFCSGSFTKLLTTFVCLSLLSEKYDLHEVLDEMDFFDKICVNNESKNFLKIFQKVIGSQFSLRDLCSYYSGLPYTFDVSEDEIEKVEQGQPFKHHSILDEKTFLSKCINNITPVYKDECKFHYSEISIIFLGYIIEKIYGLQIEELYHKYVIGKFKLQHSQFSRKKVPDVYIQDLSDQYDYPAIAILDHGYFCYSNGFFTTLNNMKVLLENFLNEPIFQLMCEVKYARAASNRIMEGLTVEIREVGEDIIYGYEGLSYSGTNIWAYSTKLKQGYLSFMNSEERAYDIYNLFGYKEFDLVPSYAEEIYLNFIHKPHPSFPDLEIYPEYQGNYHRVKINETDLDTVFVVGDHFIIIRNPDEIKYNVIFVDGNYRVRGKDGEPDSKVGLIQSKSGHKYMYYDGTLYRKISMLSS